MHPFGGTPTCPKCEKTVYAAEQIMGPGRKLYHKPCLACAYCGKRLDSFSLVEHEQKPYCKSCHVKNFGTRDLRHSNLPDRDDVFISPPTSPTRATTTLPPTSAPIPAPAPSLPPRPSPPTNSIMGHSTGPLITPRAAPTLPARRALTGNPTTPAVGGGPFDKFSTTAPLTSLLKPTRSLSPTRGEKTTTNASSSPTKVNRSSPPVPEGEREGEEDVNHNPDQPGLVAAPAFDESDSEAPRGVDETPVTRPFTPTHTGRSGVGNLPRTVPLSPTKLAHANSVPAAGNYSYSSPSTPVSNNGRVNAHTVSTATGTRYGAALSGKVGTPAGSPRVGGGAGGFGGNPVCSRCQKTVYFAEQVKAIGKTWHKGCLRCTECKTTLDSSRLTEKEGDPFCHRCYGKLYGPQGSGYALLGKAGG